MVIFPDKALGFRVLPGLLPILLWLWQIGETGHLGWTMSGGHRSTRELSFATAASELIGTANNGNLYVHMYLR